MKKTPIFLLLGFLISCSGDISNQASSVSNSLITFTVSFDSRGGSAISPLAVLPDSNISPPIVSKEGHTLEGWYTSLNGGETLEDKWNFFSDRVNFSFTLYANWIINQYTITFETNGGTSISTQTNNFNANLSIPNPTKVGHNFEGFFTDIDFTQAFIFTTMPASNLTLYAKWSINQYTITFETNGGTSVASIIGNYGDSVSTPDDPTREGYTFNGWYANANLTQVTTVPNTIPAQNLTLYAKWNDLALSTFSLNSITGSFSNVLALSDNNKIFIWGSGYDNINLGSYPNIVSFNDVIADDRVIDLKTDWNNSFYVLFNSGRLFAWGNNEYGQLGNGNFLNTDSPVEIIFNSLLNGEKIISITLSATTVFAITSEGRVYGWGGHNNIGAVGNGLSLDQSTPILLQFPFLSQGEKIISIKSGWAGKFALTNFGKVYGWGLNNDYSPLGIGYVSNTIITPTQIEFLGLDNDEIVLELYMGYDTKFALTNYGRVYEWGRATTLGVISNARAINFSGILSTEKILSIYTQGYSTFALTTLGRIYSWGSNYAGQLGLGDRNDRNNPTIISIVGLYQNEIISRIVTADESISTFAITNQNRLFGWGHNWDGTIGIGLQGSSYFSINSPTEVNINFFKNGDYLDNVFLSGYSVFAKSKMGDIYAWGANDSVTGSTGKLGINNKTNQPNPTKINFPNLEPNEIVLNLVFIGGSVFAITSSGRIYSWGNNSSGQLGLGNTNETLIPTIIQI